VAGALSFGVKANAPSAPVAAVATGVKLPPAAARSSVTAAMPAAARPVSRAVPPLAGGEAGPARTSWTTCRA
jgi:hypothetical protein